MKCWLLVIITFLVIYLVLAYLYPAQLGFNVIMNQVVELIP